MLMWSTVLGLFAVSIIVPAASGGGAMWILSAVMLPLLAGWVLIQAVWMRRRGPPLMQHASTRDRNRCRRSFSLDGLPLSKPEDLCPSAYARSRSFHIRTARISCAARSSSEITTGWRSLLPAESLLFVAAVSHEFGRSAMAPIVS